MACIPCPCTYAHRRLSPAQLLTLARQHPYAAANALPHFATYGSREGGLACVWLREPGGTPHQAALTVWVAAPRTTQNSKTPARSGVRRAPQLTPRSLLKMAKHAPRYSPPPTNPRQPHLSTCLPRPPSPPPRPPPSAPRPPPAAHRRGWRCAARWRGAPRGRARCLPLPPSPQAPGAPG